MTDTSISNIAFLTGDGQWVTPDSPLLPGIMRQSLIDLGRLKEKRVRLEDLRLYREARMINCMIDLESCHVIEMDRIIL